MADKLHPFGGDLAYDTDLTPPYTSLSDVIDIELPELAKNPSNTTHLKSPGRTKTKDGQGWIVPGEYTFKIYYHETQFQTLYNFFKSGTELNWQYTFPLLPSQTNGATWKSKGHLSNIKIEVMSEDSDDKIMVTLKIECNDLPTFTLGS